MTLPTPFTGKQLTQAMRDASTTELPEGWRPTLYSRICTVLAAHKLERGIRGTRPRCTCGDEGALISTGRTSWTHWHEAHLARALADEVEKPQPAPLVLSVRDTVRVAEWADESVRRHVESTLRARLVAEATMGGLELIEPWPPLMLTFWAGLVRMQTIEGAQVVQLEIEALATQTDGDTSAQTTPPAR